MPLDGHDLVIEPRYAKGREFMEIFNSKEEPLEQGVSLRNTFWSHRLQGTVIAWNGLDGVKWGVLPYNQRLTMMLKTLDCCFAWGIEQEANAVQFLGTLINHHQFKMYMLTGMFAERSKRSNLTYIFRRLRPTLVADARNQEPGNPARILCALCMHPIGYYAETWAGVMCPTDEVIAHLMLMRGDEPRYWRQANQHGPRMPEAGI